MCVCVRERETLNEKNLIHETQKEDYLIEKFYNNVAWITCFMIRAKRG
jgi:hypothetical protein